MKTIKLSTLLLALMTVFVACEEEDYTYIIEEDSNPPVAGYSYTLDGLAVEFKNECDDATTYTWDFGDGSTSSEEGAVSHTFAQKGIYNVVLTASDNNNASDSHSEEIKVGFPLSSFTFEVNKSVVTFANTSANSTSYLWDFGDGNTSTEANPVHTYTEAGDYTVTLKAIDGNDSDESSATLTATVKLVAVVLDWDFNVDTDGWYTVHCGFANSSDSYDLDDAEGKSTKINDDDGASGDGDMIYQVINVSTDSEYNLSFWVYQKHVGGTDGETGAVVGTVETVVNGGADRGEVLATIPTTATANKVWNNFNGDFNTGANTQVVVRLYYDYDSGATGQTEARVDYVEIK